MNLEEAAAAPTDDAPAPNTATAPNPLATPTAAAPFKILATGGLDFVSAYYFRGYLQANHGPIVQPYLNVFSVFHPGDGVIVRPYVSLFNSTALGDGNRMQDMSDVMVGATTSWKSLLVDTRYAYYTTSPVMRGAVHELGARATVDLLSAWRSEGAPLKFGVRTYAGVYGELADARGTEDIYLEAGLEPFHRFALFGREVGVSLPLVWGLSGDGYYLSSSGNNAFLGYFSTALSASVSLPTPKGHGACFLNGSVQYLHLGADSTTSINGGDRDEFIGRIGLGFSF